MHPPFLSAVIIAFNEEHNLGRCLDSLASVADEIVVVDSGSTDRTVLIARDRGARVLEHPFEGHIEQKNWAAQQATGTWVLSLDADEALSPELIESIATWKRSIAQSDAVGFTMHRLTSYCGHWVRHGGWYPDTKLRLWKAGCAEWTGENPHDRLALTASGQTHHLHGDLLHYSYDSHADHLRQIAYFSDIAAGAYTGPGWLASPAIRPLKAAFQWTKNLWIRGGWRDGQTGWTIARMSAFATAEKYRKIWGLRRMKAELQSRGREGIQRVLVSRTDAIGDVAVSLPIAGFLKSVNPDIQVDFLTRGYAAPVARAAAYVDRVLVSDADLSLDFSGYDAAILAFPDADVARALKRAGVPIRVGTGRRWPFARFVNVRNGVSRKASGMHEAWHGMDLARTMHPAPGWCKPGLAVPNDPNEWHRWAELTAEPWERVQAEIPGADRWLAHDRPNVILHAGSNNSATNWSIDDYMKCMEALNGEEVGCRVIWTGTEKEGQVLKGRLGAECDAVDTTGQMNLDQLLSLIAAADGLIASSTGPLHMAAGLGTPCVGLYAADAPMWPERWHPMGAHASWLSSATRTSSGHLDIAVNEVVATWGVKRAERNADPAGR
jgi:ADP-heptose:LPS heptosyltransferase